MALWIWALLFAFYTFHTFVNWKNNALGGGWFWFACLVSMLPVFPIAMRFSKDMLWDGLVFELVMLLSYVITLLYLGSGKAFNMTQWIGLILTVIGFVLMKARI